MLSLSQITTIAGRGERFGEHLQQGDEVGGAAAAQPVHPAPGGHFHRAQRFDDVSCSPASSLRIFTQIN